MRRGGSIATGLGLLLALLSCQSAGPKVPDPAVVSAPAPEPKPVGPCLPVETADLVELLAQQSFAPAADQRQEGDPRLVLVTRGSPRWMAAFNAALAWVNDDCPAFAEFAKQMGYRAREIIDRPTGQHHWLLSEEAGRHNGVFVFRAPAERDRARPLTLTAPHQRRDFPDPRAVQLYRQTEAAALLVNTAHPCGLEARSGCSEDKDEPLLCGGPARASDLAHSVDHMMLAVYAGLEVTRKDQRLELHASGLPAVKIAGCPATAHLSQGSKQRLLAVEDEGTWPSRLWRGLETRLGDRCVCYHQREAGCLVPGTTSVFGRLTNEETSRPFDPCGQPSERVSRRFAHLDGADVPLEAVVAAINEALPLPAPPPPPSGTQPP